MNARTALFAALSSFLGVTVAPLILVGATAAPRLRADARLTSPFAYRLTTAAGQAPAQFEVASVKPNTSGDGKVLIQAQPGGRFTATNVTLRQLIQNAYQLQEYQIAGGPSWLGRDRFDIIAKADDAGLGDPFQAGKNGGPSRGQIMLRTLLAERFMLEIYTETRELQIYALVLARSDGALGPQLRRSAGDCATPGADGHGRGGDAPMPGNRAACAMRTFPGTILAGGATLTELANGLSTLVGHLVLDRTGLADTFTFTLRWTPDQIPQGFDRKARGLGLQPIDTEGPGALHRRPGTAGTQTRLAERSGRHPCRRSS